MEKIPKLGGSFSFGFNVDKEYFDQELSFKDENATVIEDFENEFKNMTTTDIRSSLASFMFYADDIEKQIKDLSGGQKLVHQPSGFPGYDLSKQTCLFLCNLLPFLCRLQCQQIIFNTDPLQRICQHARPGALYESYTQPVIASIPF